MCGYNLLRSITLRNTMVRSSFPVLPSVLFFSLPCSPWWWILSFCLGAAPPRATCEPASLRIPLVCCLLSCVLAFYLFYFSSLPSLFSLLDVVCFVFFSCVGTIRVLSPRFRCRLRLVKRMICIWYVRKLILPVLFLSEVYDLFQLMCALSSVIICVPPEVIFHSRVIGACPVTTDCIVATS